VATVRAKTDFLSCVTITATWSLLIPLILDEPPGFRDTRCVIVLPFSEFRKKVSSLSVIPVKLSLSVSGQGR